LHQIPNIISLIRAILVFPIGFLLYQEAWLDAFILIFIAGVSDGIDGYLARTFHWQSRLGSILDPLADKLLIVIVFIILAHKGIIPSWLATLVIARDVIILAGAVSYQWLTKDLVVSPLWSSKINTALQIAFVLAIMWHLAISPLNEYILAYGQIAVAMTVLISGYYYIKCWTSYYIENLKREKQQQ